MTWPESILARFLKRSRERPLHVVQQGSTEHVVLLSASPFLHATRQQLLLRALDRGLKSSDDSVILKVLRQLTRAGLLTCQRGHGNLLYYRLTPEGQQQLNDLATDLP